MHENVASFSDFTMFTQADLFQACHLDPLLDDTVTFAKKLRDAGGRVMSMDLLDNLPHGFLNFTLVSMECREGAKICLERIKEVFAMSSTS